MRERTANDVRNNPVVNLLSTDTDNRTGLTPEATVTRIATEGTG
jgi:hypothetical protein